MLPSPCFAMLFLLALATSHALSSTGAWQCNYIRACGSPRVARIRNDTQARLLGNLHFPQPMSGSDTVRYITLDAGTDIECNVCMRMSQRPYRMVGRAHDVCVCLLRACVSYTVSEVYSYSLRQAMGYGSSVHITYLKRHN